MSDLIDRQAALDAIEWTWAGKEAFDAIKALPPVEPVSKWILCSERLPEEKGEYLVTYHPCYWDQVKEELKVGIDSFRGKTTWAKKKYQRVIAWMPLVEPYMEANDE